MNYLAHLYFADPTPASRVANLMGDFYRGRLDAALPAELREGIWRHRQIDLFTDQHPQVTAARQRLVGPRRRFAGIIVDIAFDHFLCCHWARFHPQPLERFLDGVYADLAGYGGWRPARMERPLQRLHQQRWLASYAELDTLDRALAGLAKRFSRPTPLAQGGTDIRRHYDALETDFLCFFPQLRNFVGALPRRATGAGEGL